VSLTRNLIAALALLTGVGTLSAAPNGDVEAGKTKSATCQACHGADGNTTIDGSYPKLAGQYATYLAKALHDYKSGERKNPIMAGFAATLSDQDIADLSAYFAAQAGHIKDISHLK
jgi:cytochrome c553